MVGMMATNSRERLASFVKSVKLATDIPSKLEYLQELKHDLLQEDAVFLSEFLPLIFELLSDRFSPVRKLVTEIVGDIGLKNLELLPEIVPVLINVLKDVTPAVARQAITCGIDLFRRVLETIALQGLYSSEVDSSNESSWECVLTFKNKVYSIVSQPGSEGLKLLALKFVEAMILLYTPDPDGSLEPPPYQRFEGNSVEFNISWLHGGHPILNVGDLSVEASKSLGLLLDQLRFPTVKSHSNLMIIVLIKSLTGIAKKRPAFYGRILPVLLGLDPSSSVIKGVHVYAAHHALKNAFLSCLKCTHPVAAPWRDRLVGALRVMKAGGTSEEVIQEVYQTNGCVGDGKVGFQVIKEEKPSIKAFDATYSNLGRKRSATQDTGDIVEDDDVSGKRVKSRPSVSEESTKELITSTNLSEDGVPSVRQTTSRGDGDTGPVQQLVAMFGALVAQGEKAVGSLEILISSISADLLAELVMANMRNLPQNPPKAEGDESLVNMNIVGSDDVRYPPSFLANVLSLSSSFPQIASLLSTDQLVENDIVLQKSQQDEDNLAVLPVSTVAFASLDHTAEDATLLTGLPNTIYSGIEKDPLAIPPDMHDMGNIDGEIPGLDSSAHTDVLSETHFASSLASTDLEDASQEQVTSSSRQSPFDSLPSISADKSEELSSKAVVTDANSMVSSTATSVRLACNIILPKMSAPVVNLADEEKDRLQIFAFTRIVDAYKQIALAGGSKVRSSLIAYLGVEFPLELDPWKSLQNHILSDYMNLEGHELTLQVLYRLFGEAEEDSDFFSSTNATSVYDMFLLAVAEMLRDCFPPSDKSLSRLLGEAPYIPQSVLKFLECLCSPGNFDKAEKELQGGDRVTQGLSTIWTLILLRPPAREVCLKIALQSAVHNAEEVRMKAIRLVANKLYPIASIAHKIEDFAKEMLLSVVIGDGSERTDADGSVIESQKGSDSERLSNEQLLVSVISKDTGSDTHQPCTSQSMSSVSISEAQRCMSLYFALCTKKHHLFREIFVIYRCTSNTVKQAIHRHIPILVRTMGSSLELLEIISDPPNGSEKLLIQVLHTLTDGTAPSTELILTIRNLYNSKLKDVEILIPVLPFLPKDEVLLVFPALVSLPSDRFQEALSRILQGSSSSVPVLAPAEVLIAIHGIDPDRDGIPLKKVTDACNTCFEQRQTFTQQVLAKVLNQLVEQIPLPLLFMRTVLQAIGAFPALVEFIMDILSRLVNKQIWKYPKLWVGFLKCTLLTKPQSFSVLLKLPPAQLANALNKTPALKEPLIAHASQANIQSSLPRSVLVILGIVQDSLTTTQPQTNHAQTAETSTSDTEALEEKSKESSICTEMTLLG